MDINIYTEVKTRTVARSVGWIGYILELPTNKEPATLTKFKRFEDVTKNKLELIAIIEALKRVTRKCRIHIYTESKTTATAFEQGWVDDWKTYFWLNAKGEEVKNSEQWEQLDKLIHKFEVIWHVQEKHGYREWLQSELEKRIEKERD